MTIAALHISYFNRKLRGELPVRAKLYRILLLFLVVVAKGKKVI